MERLTHYKRAQCFINAVNWLFDLKFIKCRGCRCTCGRCVSSRDTSNRDGREATHGFSGFLLGWRVRGHTEARASQHHIPASASTSSGLWLCNHDNPGRQIVAGESSSRPPPTHGFLLGIANTFINGPAPPLFVPRCVPNTTGPEGDWFHPRSTAAVLTIGHEAESETGSAPCPPP